MQTGLRLVKKSCSCVTVLTFHSAGRGADLPAFSQLKHLMGSYSDSKFLSRKYFCKC